MSDVIGVIPARYGSTRFPGKPLAKIGTKPMIQWTYENARKSKSLMDLYVATDDDRIFNEVLSFGGKVVLTSSHHPTGTDRLIEVGKIFPPDSILVNIQGDEPGIDPTLIDGVVDLKKLHRDWEMTTAAVEITDETEKKDPNRVKVVFDRNGKALYFSRSLIPSCEKAITKVFKHLGIYTYENQFLQKYPNLPPSELERSESLEQLRALEAGHSIGVYVTDHSGLSVDVPEDLEKVQIEFKKLGWI